MSISSKLLHVALLVLLVFVTRTVSAETGGGVSDSSGGVTVSFPFGDTQFANLSTYDCEHSQPFDFDFAYPWESGQAAEFFLSTSSSCDSPVGASFIGSTACTGTAACPSMVLQNSSMLTDAAAGTTTDYDSVVFGSTPPLTTGGIWAAYTEMLSTNASLNPPPYSITDATNTTKCGLPGGVDNALLYVCALINAGITAVPYGSLSIALDSSTPDAPSQPIVESGDAGLDVTWPAVTGAYYYYVHVELASSIDGGVGADVVMPVLTSDNSVSVTGLQNGTTYNVYVVAADDSGSNPPTSSNLSGPSPTTSGLPKPPVDLPKVGCASGGSGGLPAGVVLSLALAALRRRRPGDAIPAACAGSGAT